MAFQPCKSAYEADGATDNTGSSSSVLLATARENSIMIWDCSGQELSPLLGRLVASDAGVSTTSTLVDESDRTGNVDSSNDTGIPLPPNLGSSPEAAAKSLLSPALGERTVSASSNNSAPSRQASVLKQKQAAVTSLVWKGPTEPTLAATIGVSACLWDLRSSIFSGAGNLRGVGARPQTRFLPPKDEFTRTDSTLVDCAFSFDESSNRFATLDTHGVTRIWDVRKPSKCISSFEACLGGGVGIDCMPSNSGKGQFVTWGTDSYFGDGLVVKLWREQESAESNLSKDSETVEESMGDGQDNETRSRYKIVSRVTMERGAAARVHPAFRDGVLLFRDNSQKTRTRVDTTGLSTPVFGPHDNMSSSPRLGSLFSASPVANMVHTPPSPPSLVLEDDTASPNRTPETSSRSMHMNDSWKAELWEMSGNGEDGKYESDSFGAVQLSSFGGGWAEEDVLSFNNDRANVSSAMAVDLSLSDTVDGDLSLYCLTKRGRATLYMIPEVETETKKKNAIKRKREEEKREKSKVNEPPRAYRQDQWWNKEEEDDLFGSDQTRESSTKEKSLRNAESNHKFRPSENGRSRVSSSHDDEIDLSPQAIDEDQGREVSILNENHQKPIDLATAARAPCPPLCGAAFGPTGEVLLFNNGPVSKLWSLYSSSNVSIGQEKETDVAAKVNPNPRTLSDLIEMKQETEKFEWGAGDHRNEETHDDVSSSGEESSYVEDDAEVLDEDLESSDSDGFYHVDKEERLNSMLDVYFTSSRKPLLDMDTGQGRNEEIVSLPSLSPFVSVSLKHSGEIICGQSPDLADLLDVGDAWWLDSNFIQPTEVFSGSIGGINSYSRSTTELIHNESSDLPVGSLKRAATLPSSRTTVARKIKNLFVSQDDKPEPVLEGENQMSTPCENGVYVLENPQTPQATIQRLDIARRTCLHNAQVLKDFGQPSKADTWTLLAQTVDSITAGADVAITSGLVKEILRYYESCRDVQMLATITCVLTFGRDRRRGKGSNSDNLQLLPDLGDGRYDNYLLLYSNLLYRWGHLVVRAEVLKRLAHPQTLKLPDTPRVTPSGVSFLPVCARCTASITNEGGNICSNCNDFAFRCSISGDPIRGRFAWCPKCGHGGDPLLMNEWFSINSACPTGCGCVCRTVEISTSKSALLTN